MQPSLFPMGPVLTGFFNGKMKCFWIHRRLFITVSILVASVSLLVTCMNKKSDQAPAIKTSKGELFAGSEVCATCHREIYNSHIHTAHYLTSRRASAKYIKGSFDAGKNEFSFDDHVKVVMERKDSNFYQVAYSNGIEKVRKPFDIVVGSGSRGQTYLYWNDSHLFQLPIFYFTSKDEWANSPGFPHKVIFIRPVTSRCLECHFTFAKKISDPQVESEEFDKSQIIYGVDCEKCHGPAAKHVEFQSENPTIKKAEYIINPAGFTRKQMLDLCGLCHGGRLQKTQPSFSFEAGDPLSDYFAIDTSARFAPNIDVHGNQFGLLAASKCFNYSQMTCVTCHNTHENERGRTELFSQRCMSCHNPEHGNFCKLSATIGPAIKQNCIDCHMPEQTSKAIIFLEQGAEVPTAAVLRTHLITIYRDETQKVLGLMKKNSNIPGKPLKK